MLSMYFHSGVKKLLWFCSGEGFWGWVFLSRAIYSQEPEGIGEKEAEAGFHLWRRKVKLLSVPAQVDWTYCWYQSVHCLKCDFMLFLLCVENKPKGQHNEGIMYLRRLQSELSQYLSFIQTCGIEKSRALSDLENWSFHRGQWVPLWYL